MSTLIITNGDGAAELLAQSGQGDAVLPWRDILHEGPLHSGNLDDLAEERAVFLAHRFDLDAEEIAADFRARNATLADHGDFDRIELWFEHDLYDQLQLIQIVNFFKIENRLAGVVLVQADDYLGHQSPITINRFRAAQRDLTSDDLERAEGIWSALTAATPEPALGWSGRQGSGFPFLGTALNRFVEELPDIHGLSRSERTLLNVIDAGAEPCARLFAAVLEQEEAAFMGDVSFMAMIDDLSLCAVPLIDGLSGRGPDPVRLRNRSETLNLTEAGRAVLAGSSDHVALNGLDRWWAGTRLRGRDVWRYDRTRQVLIPPVDRAQTA